jgi:probable rRNA maturation factor
VSSTTVHIVQHFPDVPADEAAIGALTRHICERFGAAQATVSIAIVDDAEISRLNEQFLGHEGTTDCLSFDLSDAEQRDTGKVFDLVVNGALAVREAERRGHSAQAELALYIAHALLHNLGFDDATTEQAQIMHRTEDEILQHLGYGLVYDSGERAQ